MNKFLLRSCAVFLLLFFVSSLPAQITKLRPGMSDEEFRGVMPGVLPTIDAYNKRITNPETVAEVPGVMVYNFVNGNLDNMNFTAQIDGFPIDASPDVYKEKAPASFKQALGYTRKMIDAYKKKFGEPVSYREENIENYKPGENRFSTSFIDAEWKSSAGGSVRLSFYFIGQPMHQQINGPGVYPLEYMLTVNYEGTFDDLGTLFLPGMSAKACEKKSKTLFPGGTGTEGVYEKNETIEGMSGSWTFCFEKGQLTSFRFYFYYSEGNNPGVDERAYTKYYRAAEHVVESFEKTWGKPSLYEHPGPRYEDPAQHVVQSAEVHAAWQQNMNISLTYAMRNSNPKMGLRNSVSFEVVFYNLSEEYIPYSCGGD